jgi:hypothetical protein
MTVAPGRALRVGKHTTGVYTAADKEPISRLTTAPTVPRRRNATVPAQSAYEVRRALKRRARIERDGYL